MSKGAINVARAALNEAKEAIDVARGVLAHVAEGAGPDYRPAIELARGVLAEEGGRCTNDEDEDGRELNACGCCLACRCLAALDAAGEPAVPVKP